MEKNFFCYSDNSDGGGTAQYIHIQAHNLYSIAPCTHIHKLIQHIRIRFAYTSVYTGERKHTYTVREYMRGTFTQVSSIWIFKCTESPKKTNEFESHIFRSLLFCTRCRLADLRICVFC